MKKKKWIGALLSGGTVAATSRRGLDAMARRRGTVIVDYWRADDPPPFGSTDAAAWADYRTAHGYAGER